MIKYPIISGSFCHDIDYSDSSDFHNNYIVIYITVLTLTVKIRFCIIIDIMIISLDKIYRDAMLHLIIAANNKLFLRVNRKTAPLSTQLSFIHVAIKAAS